MPGHNNYIYVKKLFPQISKYFKILRIIHGMWKKNLRFQTRMKEEATILIEAYKWKESCDQVGMKWKKIIIRENRRVLLKNAGHLTFIDSQ